MNGSSSLENMERLCMRARKQVKANKAQKKYDPDGSKSEAEKDSPKPRP